MPVLAPQRIVLLGKTGVGKSSLANILIKDDVFEINHSANSGTSKCQTKSTAVSGRSITVIDTPSLFDTNMDEKKPKEEILRCMIEASPGPHVFLILLKVEKFAEEEETVIKKMSKYFSEESFRFAAVVFTHGDQLPEGTKIEEFVDQTDLRDLVKKCGGRCHVIDNKYWKKPQDDYRNNEFQVAELFKTIDEIIEENNGGYYTNEMLEKVEEQIAEEEKRIRESSANLTEEEIRERATEAARQQHSIPFSSTAGGAVLGALCGGITIAVFAPALAVGGAVAGVVAVGSAVGAAVGAAVGEAVSEVNTAEAAGAAEAATSSPARGSEPEAAEGGDTPLNVFRVYDMFRRGGYHRLSQQKKHQS